ADRVRDVCRPEVEQLVPETPACDRLLDPHCENEERDCDREDAVAERLDSRGLHREDATQGARGRRASEPPPSVDPELPLLCPPARLVPHCSAAFGHQTRVASSARPAELSLHELVGAGVALELREREA